MKEIQNMDVKTASEFLESQYGYYNAIYAYEDLEIHKGTAEEINHYIEQKLSKHSFSWYFAKKFTDFAGLHMAFFATVLLSFLFIQDTRKNTYELLHTKPVTAIQYICGKVISGFISMLGVLVILNVIFFMLCLKTSLESGFPVTPIDFCVNSLIYIVPNLLMICCVYTITALIFKNPLPAAPILFLHIIYSNMLTMKNDIYYMRQILYYGAIPWQIFETHRQNVKHKSDYSCNFISYIIVCISVWKKEEGSLETELKNCLYRYIRFFIHAHLYDIVCYSSDYIPKKISPSNSVSIAFFNNYFCIDTYLMEVKVSVPMYFICMIKKSS